MPQFCTICIHLSRQAIDAELLANRDSLRTIAARHNVSRSSLGRHYLNHLEPGQDALPQRIGEPQQVSEPGQTSAPEASVRTPHYDNFVQRLRNSPSVSLSELRGWGYPEDVLQGFIDVALVRGDLSRRSEPRQ